MNAAFVVLRTMPHLISNLPSETDSIDVGGKPLLLWRPTDAEKLVLETSQADFGDDERLPYWAILWPASIALANFLMELPDLTGKRVLELGAGLGVAGLAAARAGATVVISDWYDEPLEFVQSSARLNGLEIETRHLDWRFPPAGEQYDYILGADLLYERRNHAPIIACAAQLLAPGGRLLLSDPKRHTSVFFLETASELGWTCIAHPSTITWEGATFDANCWDLTKA
jgi:predicted nicotinamide N-methyase